MRLVVGLFAMALALAGCRNSRIAPMDLASERVATGVDRGADASNDGRVVALKVRYNPAPCECPAYEIFAYGHWLRAFIDIETSALDTLRTADTLAIATINGVIGEEGRVAPNGVEYPIVTD